MSLVVKHMVGTVAIGLLSQGSAHDFLIVAGVDGFVGEGGVGPDDVAAGGGVGGLEEMGAADFVVTAWREASDDEIAFFVWEEIAITIFDKEGVRPADFFAARRGLERFPNAFAGFSF